MGKILIINASPRAPKSNSRRYADRFMKYYKGDKQYIALTKTNHLHICRAMENASDVLLVFPLYADGIPVTLLNFLKTLEQNSPKLKPIVSILMNCGFIEPSQNDIAIKMIQLYCYTNGYPFGSALKIGSGEAILSTPFVFLADRKIKKLAILIDRKVSQILEVTMPISKKMFIKASRVYWRNYGRKNGVSAEQMAIMQIEDH